MTGSLIAMMLAVAAPQASSAEPDPAAAALIACKPETYDAALACLDKALPADSKAKLKADGAVMAHFGLGMFIRNNWGLWKGGPLKTHMQAAGFTHPDNMSGAILDGYVAKLRGEPYALDASAGKAQSGRGQTNNAMSGNE